MPIDFKTFRRYVNTAIDRQAEITMAPAQDVSKKVNAEEAAEIKRLFTEMPSSGGDRTHALQLLLEWGLADIYTSVAATESSAPRKTTLYSKQNDGFDDAADRMAANGWSTSETSALKDAFTRVDVSTSKGQILGKQLAQGRAELFRTLHGTLNGASAPLSASDFSKGAEVMSDKGFNADETVALREGFRLLPLPEQTAVLDRLMADCEYDVYNLVAPVAGEGVSASGLQVKTGLDKGRANLTPAQLAARDQAIIAAFEPLKGKDITLVLEAARYDSDLFKKLSQLKAQRGQ